jgi:competence protein ComEC
MKKALGQAPLFKVLLPMLAGIILAIQVIPVQFLLTVSAVVFGAGLLLFLTFRFLIKDRFRYQILPGIAMALIITSIGIANIFIHRTDQRPDFFGKNLKYHDSILVKVAEPLLQKDNYFKARCEVMASGHAKALKPASGSVLLYFEKDSTTNYPAYGDILWIQNNVNPIEAPGNAWEFDYRQYMAYQNIYYSAYLKADDRINTGKNAGNHFWKVIFNTRTALAKEIEEALPGTNEKGIAKALVLGDESDIPNEIMGDYAGTGTLHILSVSGLHIGIILFGLSWITGFLIRFRHGRIFRIFLILAFIWAYAFLTGFSAPVARSVIMFSIVFIGINSGREANIYNSICGSAMILLLLDPYQLMQAGFQLSYIALTGIVWLQPRIADWWKPGHKVMNYFWQLAAASIAAQIITLPITVLYFNKFSVYFLPANLIIIPISFIVLGAGILFVFIRMLPWLWLHAIVGKILFGCTWFLNFIAHAINHLPGAVWDGLYITNTGAILLYIVIMAASFGLIFRNKKFIVAALSILILFLILRNSDTYSNNKINELIISNISAKQTIITIKEANHLLVFADSSLIKDPQQVKYHVNAYAWFHYIYPGDISLLDCSKNRQFKSGNFMMNLPWLQFHNQKLLWIDGLALPDSSLPLSYPLDALVLSNNARVELRELYKKFPFKHVIAATGNDAKKIMDWESECFENNIPFTNLQTMHGYHLQVPVN